MKPNQKSILGTLPVLAAGALCSTGLDLPALGQDAAQDPATSLRPIGQDWVPSNGGIAGNSYAEDYESGFLVGPIDGQNGWIGTAGQAFVTNLNTLEGSFSARHVSDGSGSDAFHMESPVFPTEFGRVGLDVRITGLTSEYQVIPQDKFLPAPNDLFNTRVKFNQDTGTVQVAQVNMAKTQFDFIDTGVEWTVGVDYRLCFEVLVSGDLNVFLDGDLIFEGVDANFQVNGASHGIGQLIVFSDNMGVGTIGGSGDTLTLDDINDQCDPSTGPATCPEDTNGDGEVEVPDLVNAILLWDGPGIDGDIDADVDDDGIVGVSDLVAIILAWGFCPLENDDCTGRIVVTDGDTTFSLFGDSIDAAVPAFTCGTPENDVWFNYTASCDGQLTIDTIGSEFDAILAVYSSHDCPTGGLLGCDDNSAGDGAAVVSLEVLTGDLLKIRVGGTVGDSDGVGVLNIACQVEITNDECIAAELLDISSGSATVSGQTTGATLSAEAMTCGLVCPNSPDVWYRVQGTGNSITASLCGENTDFVTVMLIYCGTDCASLGCINSDDDGCTDMPGIGAPSEVTWCSDAAETYWINIQGLRSVDTGNFELTVTDGAFCPEPDPCLAGPQGPANDDCINATALVGNQTLVTNTIGACTDGLPHGTCQFDGQTYQDIWYTYTADCDGSLLVSTCNQTAYDSDLAVYDATNWPANCPPTDTDLISCADDGEDILGQPCADSGSRIQIDNVTMGDQFLIRVGGWQEGFNGEAMLTVECFVPDISLCQSAEPIGPVGNAQGAPSVFNDNNCGAKLVDMPPDCGNGQPLEGSHWYRTVGDGTTFTASLCGTTDSNWDSRLSVYCGDCTSLFCDLPAMFEPINGCGPLGQNEEFSWCTDPGVTYFILVHSAFSCGDYQLEVTSDGSNCATPVCQPCDLNCTGNSEPEPCGDDVNGGCLDLGAGGGQAAMTAATDGDTWCGTIWAENKMRDTDWYLVEVGASGEITANLTSEAPCVVMIIEDPNWDNANECFVAFLSTIGIDHSDDCVTGTAMATGLPTGQLVYVFVSTETALGGPIFDGIPCSPGDNGNEYELEILAP